jgi:hypothetical protein
MSTTASSKYAENQFLAATINSYSLMSEILSDTVPRATSATAGNAAFTGVLADLNTVANHWVAGETLIANAEAALPGTTLALDDKIASLTRKPDADTSSILENWDTTIRGQVAYQGPTYMTLLPQGRETVTAGTRDQQLDALRDFGIRLTAQTTKPVLVTLGGTVTAFANDARALRTAQTNAKSNVETTRQAQEALRVSAANALYALIGQGIVTWSADPSKVDTLWNVNILRNPPLQVPDAPANTVWDASARTLSTIALPNGATRLEAWRRSPGGMPELLVTTSPGVTAAVIPTNITFIPGSLYQLWLVGINSKGSSAPGPVQDWTAV